MSECASSFSGTRSLVLGRFVIHTVSVHEANAMLTENQATDLADYQYKIVRHFPQLCIMIQQGANVNDCAEYICRMNGWCFVNDKEYKLIQNLIDFIIL